jgi:DNA-binding transcriptional ArsR family regulator
MTAQLHKEDNTREEIFHYIREQIQKSEDREFEANVTVLGNLFKKSGPTIDHHLKALEKEGRIFDTGKRGKYGRKIYRLSHTEEEVKPPSAEIITPLDDKSVLDLLIQVRDHALGLDIPEPTVVQDQIELEIPTQTVEKMEPKVEVETPAPEIQVEKEAPVQEEPKQDEFLQQLEQREKSLEEQIDDFKARASVMPKAQDLLTKNDREILAVMNQDLHQFILYLQDLSQQLSTVEDKNFILRLLDEREKHLETIKQQEEEIKNLQMQIRILQSEQSKQKEEKLDLSRVQFMISRLTMTVDNYVDLPGHAKQLKANDFKKQHTKELNDLYKYIAGLED